MTKSKMEMEKIFEKIEYYLLLAVVLLFPVTVLPISPNPFVVPKLAVLAFGAALVILVKTLKVIVYGKLELRMGKYDLPVALIGIAYVASTIVRTPNKMEAFLLPGTATIVVTGVLLYFLINQLEKKGKSDVLKTLCLSSAVFAVLELLAFAKIFEKIPQLPNVMKTQYFTPEGGFLPAALFFASMLPIGIGNFLTSANVLKKTISATASTIILFGLLISVYNLLPGRPYQVNFPSYSTGWNIAVEALKESPVLGIGPGNYLTAFNRFRPLSFNNTKLWAVKFTTARSFYLTVLTETGLLGISGIILLLLALYRNIKNEIQKGKCEFADWGVQISPNSLSLIIILVSLILFPATLLIVAVLFILLSSVTTTSQTLLNLKTQSDSGASSRFPALLIGVPVLIALLLFFYQGGRMLAAEYNFYRGVNALANNEAQKTYDFINNAIRLNFRVDRYRLTSSRVNLALANSVALQARGSSKSEATDQQTQQISDQDRSTITQLIQIAISEAKAAVALNPLRSGNWEVLASTYQSIIPLAQGADTFAIQSYSQAVALDPINPNLRIALGGVYYASGDYDSAIRVLELATLTKNDHANAHYNLAYAYRDDKRIDKAINEMTLVLSLLDDKTTRDYEIARQALEDMQEKRASEAQAGEELTPPQEAEKPVLEPPIELLEESEPPEAPIPTPTPSEEGSEEEATGTISLTITPQPTPTPTPQS